MDVGARAVRRMAQTEITMRMRIASLDDELAQRDLIRCVVTAAGHSCQLFETGQALIRALRSETFDLIVVDWTLPDMGGPEVVRWIRANVDAPIPILFVTNRSDERDVVEGLASGADDYLIKPIRVRELQARVSALQRRAYPGHQDRDVIVGRCRFDVARRVVLMNEVEVSLTPREYDLGLQLFRNLGRVMSRSHLMALVWGTSVDIPSRSLDTHMCKLRAKLNLRPEHGFRLTSEYGYGYRLECLERDEAAASRQDQELDREA
jgi:DNA-binding response OmpR family regulator